ncbi:sugar phosphate isomerase/epimerase [Nocardioides sp. NBC_00850]|uniref:sugar phosphate isomerase/epimerase family protein n=1 Tax=Nocardioides sp. NBC_00850 TaxID=2976001 RepID=UPI00386A8981|nr:sugar phosphate isomerase/epimerase [Nocardioides sp. NBC_00850]
MNRDLLATCWTWAGDTAPARDDESSPIPIADRVAAVAAAGWKGVGIVHADVVKIRESIGLRSLRSMLDDHGISEVQLEFISNWWTDGDLRRESDRVRNDLFDAAATLGTTTIKVGAGLQAFGEDNPIDLGAFAESFDALATDAGKHGVRVALEPMPMANIRTIAEGAKLVTEVGNAHGGLVVDTWHVGRAGTSYADLPTLLPMDHVFVVELDDADAEVKGSLWDDTINNRRMPGDGALDTAGFIAAMLKAGWEGGWGVEIISDELRALPVGQGVQQVFDKTQAAIDQALERI